MRTHLLLITNFSMSSRTGRPLLSVFRPSNMFAKTFHEGGFDQQMNKREAAMILECKSVSFSFPGRYHIICRSTPRENADKKDILNRYKKLMMLNHPDQVSFPAISLRMQSASTSICREDRNISQPKLTRRRTSW